jgi:uncharacterized protein
VLVYAHRADERSHPRYRRWLGDLVNGSEPFALSVLVAVGFVRIVTNERIYLDPTPITSALAAIDQIAGHPRCWLPSPGSDHWKRVSDLCRATAATGKLVADTQHDAQHAALALGEGCI